MADRININLGNGQSASVDIDQFVAAVSARMQQCGRGIGAKFSISVDEGGLSLSQSLDATGSLVRLRKQALEAARLLSATPDIEQQIADALVLLPAMQRWTESLLTRSHMDWVLAQACIDAESAQEAIDLAERTFSFLNGEAAPPVAGGR